VKVPAEQFVKKGGWLTEFAPIEELRVRNLDDEKLGALLRSRYLRWITTLDLDHEELGDTGAARIADCPNLPRLEHLSLHYTAIRQPGLQAFASSSHLQSLRSLGLRDDGLTAEAFAAFVGACRLPSFERLTWNGELRPASIQALAASPLAGRMSALSLEDGEIGPDYLRTLTAEGAFPKLTNLKLRSGELAGSLGMLTGSSLLRQLESLEFSAMRLGDEDIRQFAAAPKGSLRNLDLDFNQFGPAGAKALVESPLCDSLSSLSLSYNPIKDGGAKALASSQHLGVLRRLELTRCGITREGAKSLLASPLMGQLDRLVFYKNDIGPKASAALRTRLGEGLFFDGSGTAEHLTPEEVVRLVKTQPPRCLRGFVARTDTELLRRFPRDRLDQDEYPSVAFELSHPDPTQRAVLLGFPGFGDPDFRIPPYAIRWEPSGEQREFYDSQHHGRSGEDGGDPEGFRTGKRLPWKCGRRGCRDHTFLVTFYYRFEYLPTPSADPTAPLRIGFITSTSTPTAPHRTALSRSPTTSATSTAFCPCFERCSPWSGLFLDPAILEEAAHHFIPALLAPRDKRIGVGIVWIRSRIVVNHGEFDCASLGNGEWLSQIIVGLPVEVVARDRQE
jgi:Leucine Rich repeat